MSSGLNFDQFFNLDQFEPTGANALSDTFLDSTVLNDSNYASEVFQQYLGPELAKANPTTSTDNLGASSSDTSISPHPFFENVLGTGAIPGSPIDGISPASDNSTLNKSPFSINGVDFDSSTPQDWSMDTSSLFGSTLPPLPELPESELLLAPKVEPDTFDAVLPAPSSLPIQSTSRPSRTRTKTPVSVYDEDSEDELELPKTTRKRKAASSGSAAKLPKTSVAAFASATLHPTSAHSTLPPVPEWLDRPDAETYKKMSSKEKRQLRNKISARNFRHRRKEYITTLEEEIAGRDSIIGELRDEVGTMKSENQALRGEVSLLKQKWDEMMEKMTSMNTPAAISTIGLGLQPSKIIASAMAESSKTPADALVGSPPSTLVNLPPLKTRNSNGIMKPNMKKDVSLSNRAGTNNWTGLGGGITSVHTTLVPEFNLDPKAANPFTSTNFNPTLNNLTEQQRSELALATTHLRGSIGAGQSRTDTNFFDTNPFWLRSENIEDYRGQLYSKISHNAAGAALSQKHNIPTNEAGQFQELPTGFRPAFFASPTPEVGNNDLLAFQSPRVSEIQQRHSNAAVGALAAETVLSKLLGSFMDAFSGSSPNAEKGILDGKKVASVLSGRSKLTVIPTKEPNVDDLEQLLGTMNLSSTKPSTTITGSCSFEDVCNRWTGNEAEKRPGASTA